MNKTIWKFKIEPQTEIKMPVGARILSIHEQNNEAYIWATVDKDAQLESRVFYFFTTGGDLPNMPEPEGRLDFIGTVHLFNGSYVCHVFEIIK